MGARTSGGGLGRTLAVTLGLLLLSLALVSLARSAFAAREVAPERALADWIEPGPLPFGLVPDEARRRGDELLVAFSNPDAGEEAPRAEQPKKEPRGERERKGQPEPYDWSTLEIGPAGTPPVELLAVRYGPGAAERVEALFEDPESEESGRDRRGGVEVEEIKTFGAAGGRALMDRGRLRWFDYDVLFVHERELERGGTFRDVVRVNLSLPGRPLVLYVRWPRGLPASTERVAELLAAMPPRATAP